MLFQDLIEHAPTNEQTAALGIEKIIEQSARFVFDENATRAMCQLALMRPSNILDARAFLKPPALPMWIEYLDPIRKQVWIDNGWEIDEAAMHPNRNGLLITDGGLPNHVLLYSFWNFRNDPEPFYTTPMSLMVNLDLEGPYLSDINVYRRMGDMAPFMHDFHFKNQPEEIEALNKMKAYGRAVPSALIPWSLAAMKNAPPHLYESWVGDIGQELLFMLASLLMLNAKNLGERETVRFEKLNKQRAKKGKPLLREYTEIRLRIPRGSMGTGSGTHGAKAAHWCRGHFKIRKTGVFWWNPHVRGMGGGMAAASSGKTYKVKG